MRKLMSLLMIVLLAVAISGCYTTGLSLRERGNFNYSNFIYGLYGKDTTSTKEIKKVNLPIRVAVAQVGENAPPKLLLDKLESERYLVSKVTVIPAGGSEPNYYSNNDKKPDLETFEERMTKMRRLAKDLDTDYIFLIGGSTDIGETQSWMGFWDITILGAFIIPSHRITAEGRASGALIDVDTGRVLFVVSSEKNIKEYATTGSVDGRQNEIMAKVRDGLVDTLADEFIHKVKSL